MCQTFPYHPYLQKKVCKVEKSNPVGSVWHEKIAALLPRMGKQSKTSASDTLLICMWLGAHQDAKLVRVGGDPLDVRKLFKDGIKLRARLCRVGREKSVDGRKLGLVGRAVIDARVEIHHLAAGLPIVSSAGSIYIRFFA